MRVAIAEFKQETNTFVPHPTTLADFENWHLWRGQDVIDRSAGTNVEVAGFLDVLGEARAEIAPLLATFAISGGRVATATFNQLRDELLDRLHEACPVDGVLLALHGAMVTDDDDDPDGAIIAAVREVVGPDLPLVVTFDLHANLTRRCVAGADAIVAFKTSPHVDQRDTGRRGARLLLQMLRAGARPVSSFVKLPMISPASLHMHHVPGPFQRLMDAANASETGALLAASIFPVQPWLDIAEMGYAVLAVADRDQELAARVAADLAELVWREREALTAIDLVSPAAAIERALAAADGPVVLSDLADNPGAGSPGDATAVIAALLGANPRLPALAAVRDPAAARAAIAAGVGTTVTVEIGGKLDHIHNRPIALTGEVTFAGPAAFRFAGGAYTGVEMVMGECAVVRAGQVSTLILTNSVMNADPALYRAVGLEPADARIVVVKSHSQFRAGYAGIAKEIILLDSPGLSSDRLDSVPFTKLPRPYFPLDRGMLLDSQKRW